MNRHITQNISCKGKCLDSAMIENFFGILKIKIKLLYLQEFESAKYFYQELDGYMVYYKQKQLKSKLKKHESG
ncbi:IS3 family transposase [Planococcus sp. A6]|uniref:IS3 family transposase n=1 Tax=Planococcus sp. A6 TaxID=2992760 RepID=UPI0038B3C90B